MKKIYRYHTSLSLSMRFVAKLTVCLLLSSSAYSQTVNDVLEKGNHVKKGSDIYFKLDLQQDSLLHFGVLNKKDAGKAIDYEFNSDSVLFLTSDNNTDVFMQPLNPLNFTVSSVSKLIPDAISKAESDALKGIRELLISTMKENAVGSGEIDKFQNISAHADKAKDWNKRQLLLKKVEEGLASDYPEIKKINQIFLTIKNLDFVEQNPTRTQFNAAVKDTGAITEHLKKMDSIIQLIETDSKSFKGNSTISDDVLFRYVYQDYARSLRDAYHARKKQYTNLKKAINLVGEVIKNAEYPDNHWHIKLRPISVTKSENAVYTVTVDTNTWNMNEDGVLVQKSGGKKISRPIVVRKFQLLVPEVSVGTYYTFFKYKVYGTTSDSTGQQFVAEPTFSILKRFNASVMLNYNFYIPNTPVRPLLQFGGGIQSGIPVLMAGGGLRIGNSNAFCITGGVALTWMRELQTLKVGDRVSGTAELEKDLKYEFSFPLKGYIGIQYNF